MTTEASTAAIRRAEALATEPLRPAGPRRGFVGGTAQSARDLWAHRELLGRLVKRELKARYKDSSLGFIWSLARPLAMLLIYYVALGQFLGQARGLPGFAVFIYSGLTAWGFFSEAIQTSTSSVVNNAGLVKKVYLPREVFPLASIGSAAFNFAIQLVVLLLATLLVGHFPTGDRWGYFVLSVLVLFLYATAFGIFLSAVNVYLRDVQYLVEIALMIFFWASPIVYAWNFVQDAIAKTTLSQGLQHALMNIYLNNPATAAALGFQRTFWVQGDTPHPEMNPPYVPHFVPDLALRLGIIAAVGVVLVWLASRVFARMQANFAQEL